MERNQYYMSLRNGKRYNLDKYDNNYTNDIDKNDSYDNLKNENKDESLLTRRKTPLILTPKLMLNNNNRHNNSIKINPNKSSDLSNSNINSLDINYNNKTNANNNSLLNDEYIKMDEDNVSLSTIHWKYDGPTGLNTEKKHFPTKLNIGNYFKTKIKEVKNPFSSFPNQSDYINPNEFNSNYLISNKNNNIFNNKKNNNNNISILNGLNKNNENSDKQLFNVNNISSKSQKIINKEPRSKSYKNYNIYNNNFPYDNNNDYYNKNNLYVYDEKSEYMVKRYNKDNINEWYKDDMKDMDDFYGNKKYRYYNPKRNDYRGSRFGDYNYNYYLNAPMRGDKSQSWKFPPLYYYNSGYKIYNRDNGYHN